MNKKMSCRKCKLHQFRRNMVKGRGVIPADILFLGEAPGRSEDLIGEAFIGRSGKLLDKMIQDTGIGDVSFYITNTVMCRPCDSRDSANREPSSSEVLACMSNIYLVINEVNPSIIILVGKVAEKYYGKEFPDACKIQHPAFILRQGGVKSPWYNLNVQKLKEAFK